MKDEVLLQGKKFVSLSRAGDVCGYSENHIIELCSAGKISCQDISGSKYIDEVELLKYRQSEAFGSLRYVEEEEPLMPKINKKIPAINKPTTVTDKSTQEAATLREAVDPSLLTGFTVNQFGQKVVALGIALFVVFGVGLALNSKDLKYTINDLSILVYKFTNVATDHYIDTLATIWYTDSDYTALAIEPIVGESSFSGVEEKNSLDNSNSIFDPLRIPPFIILRGDNPITIFKGENYSDPGAIVEDNRDEQISYTISPGILDTSSPGEFVVTISATDSDGNTTVAERLVVVAEFTDQEFEEIGVPQSE